MANLITKTLRSEVLNRDFEVEISPVTGGPTHGSLQNLIYNELGNVEISTNIIKCELGHSVVIIDMTYQNRHVSQMGETTEKNLKGEIATAIPVTMAYNRAFDRAALALIGVFGLYAATEDVPHQENSSYYVDNNVGNVKEENNEKPEISASASTTPATSEHNIGEMIVPFKEHDGQFMSVRWLATHGFANELVEFANATGETKEQIAIRQWLNSRKKKEVS